MDLDGVCVRVQEMGGQLVLVPQDQHAAEFIAKLTRKKDVLVTIRSPRNPDHHKFFFKYLSRVLENTDGIWKDVEELLEAVKFAVGHTSRFRSISNEHGKDLELAREISLRTLYWGPIVNTTGTVQIPLNAVAKIVSALRRGADEYITRTRSISFANMGEERFHEFHDKAVLALNTFLGWDTSVLMKKENESD